MSEPITIAEIFRARELAAEAFNVELEELTKTGGQGGHATRARHCVCWLLLQWGHSEAEIADALFKTKRGVKEAIESTETVLRISPEKRSRLAA